MLPRSIWLLLALAQSAAGTAETWAGTGWEKMQTLGDDVDPLGYARATALKPTNMRGASTVLFDGTLPGMPRAHILVLFGGRSQTIHRCIHQASNYSHGGVTYTQDRVWPAECGDDDYLGEELVMDAAVIDLADVQWSGAPIMSEYPEMRCAYDCNNQGTCAYYPKPLPGYTYCICMDDFRGDVCDYKEDQSFENDVWYLDLNRWDNVGTSCSNYDDPIGGTLDDCKEQCYQTYQCTQLEHAGNQCRLLTDPAGCTQAGGTSWTKALPKWKLFKWEESRYYLAYDYKLTDDLPWPNARYNHEAVVKEVDGDYRMYVTGGYGPRCVPPVHENFCRDTWFWDFQLEEWVMDTEPSPFNAGMALGGRWGFCMLGDPESDDIFFFGGHLRNYYLNDFNVYDVKQKRWMQMDRYYDANYEAYNTTHPITRAFHTCSWNWDYSQMCIFGGYHSTRQGLSEKDAVEDTYYLNDFWCCNKAQLKNPIDWEGCVRHLQNNLHGRHWLETEYNHFDYSPQRTRGAKMICVQEPLFQTDQTERTQTNAEYGHDFRGEVCYVFGGYAQNHFASSTWRYRIADQSHEKETWRRHQPPTLEGSSLQHPEPRSEVGVIFDKLTESFWLFGGYGPDNAGLDNEDTKTNPMIYYDDLWMMDLRACPNNCSGNGECMHGYCLCDNSWWGVDCSAYYCPSSNCTAKMDNHGDWWTQICLHCSGAGTCDGVGGEGGDATCECDDGYEGDHCENFFCPSKEKEYLLYLTGGEEDRVCHWPAGVCEENLTDGVYAGDPPTCDCDDAHRMPNCKRKKCAGILPLADDETEEDEVYCKGRGLCTDGGVCDCYDAPEEGKRYSGLDCGRLIAQPAPHASAFVALLAPLMVWLLL